MHIAFFTPEYPSSHTAKSAGIGTSIKNLSMALLEKGVQVTVFVYEQPKEGEFEEQGVNLILIKGKYFSILSWYFQRKHLAYVVNKYRRKYQFDLVETQDWTGIAAFLNLKCPLVVRLHGTDTYFCNLESRPIRRKTFFLEKMGLKNADRIVSVSRFTAQKTKEIFGLSKHIDVIHNGINTEQFKPEKTTIKKNQILYFGTIIRKKGVLDLAKAFNILIETNPEAELVVLGKDVIDVFENRSTKELMLEDLSEVAKKQIRFVAEVPYKEVRDYLLRSKLIVLPSHAEAFPMTWLEAMAMEKPMVTSNIGWANEMVIENETGLMVDPKNSTKFASSMKLLLDNDQLAEKLGKAARQHFLRSFSSEVIVEKNIRFYKEVIDGV